MCRRVLVVPAPVGISTSSAAEARAVEELGAALRDLRSPEPAKRLAASRALERAARMVSNADRKKALGRRVATAALVKAFGDGDPKVVQNSMIALAEISRRYFKDDRAYPAVVRLLGSPDHLTRNWAATAAVTLTLRGEASWPDVSPLVRDRSAKVRAAVILEAVNLAAHTSLSPHVHAQLLVVSGAAVNDGDRQVREYAANLQRHLAAAVRRQNGEPDAASDGGGT